MADSHTHIPKAKSENFSTFQSVSVLHNFEKSVWTRRERGRRRENVITILHVQQFLLIRILLCEKKINKEDEKETEIYVENVNHCCWRWKWTNYPHHRGRETDTERENEIPGYYNLSAIHCRSKFITLLFITYTHTQKTPCKPTKTVKKRKATAQEINIFMHLRQLPV